mmetsp:Transcript_49813/g.115653  ORF Transcript_49813/g.115653 Transcript_49813/m.115653 type:complete len:335 (-) Transcript_49813:200-1204(-)|eukprot:CAMPEP_0171107022 /NCGR_PEP_ID=MMETSP0766_2-20121228/65986_1 /TAXON_ID=439317 /ORGANISM="Gambierdiscus australes, Strain CAWD 149" /LENGTH=334 /DNA_ID=CAMNT_0011568241 /DNA_START=64 /DNA_END=1068 /DNA_ORIENTATION=+
MGCGTSSSTGVKDDQVTISAAGGTSQIVPADTKLADESQTEKPEVKPEPVTAGDNQPPAALVTNNANEAVAAKASCVQEDLLQELLKKRLGTAAGERLRIQDVGPNFEDRLPEGSVRRPSSVGLVVDNYAELHQKEFADLLELENKEWALKKKDDSAGVDIYTRYDDSRGAPCFKGVTNMRLNPKDGLFYLLENLLDASKRPEWDDMCLHGEVVEQALPYYRISYFQVASPVRGFVSDRDVLLIGRFRFEDDGTLLVPLVSTTHKAKPEDPNFVRLNFLCGGYIVRKTGENDVYQVSFMGAVDVMGWVPTFIKNLAAWKQAQVLAKFKTCYKLG